MAILRYRLYDIDRLISRTVGYTLLTGVLVSIYIASVLLAARLLGGSSDLGIAVATLAVAAVFQPARRRIQRAVDHRFNRRRYDAQRIIEAFGARLRHELDLDSLGSELTNAVAQTMEPAMLSLWLRDPQPEAARSNRPDPREGYRSARGPAALTRRRTAGSGR